MPKVRPLSAKDARATRPPTAQPKQPALLPRNTEAKAMQRLDMPGTVHGRRDWVLDAHPLVQEVSEALESKCQGFQDMVASLFDAARCLDDESWRLFCELPSRRMHKEDSDMLGSQLASLDKAWSSMLARAKRQVGGSWKCVHVGVRPISSEMRAFLQASEWDVITDGQKEPEGCQYPLVLVNLAFPPALLARSQDDQDERSGLMARLSDVCAISGYGLLGETRDEGMQKRLQMLRYTLVAAMQRLAPHATLLISWSGLPDHPVLLFLTSHLRLRFSQVQVTAHPDATTFEVYILCTGFVELSDQVEDWYDWGLTLEYFLSHKAHRIDGYDDVLLWSLSHADMLREAKEKGIALDAAGKPTKAKAAAGSLELLQQSTSKAPVDVAIKGTYDTLWTMFAAKYKALALELVYGTTAAQKCRSVLSDGKMGPGLSASAMALQAQATSAGGAAAQVAGSSKPPRPKSAAPVLLRDRSGAAAQDVRGNCLEVLDVTDATPGVIDTRELRLVGWHSDVYKAGMAKENKGRRSSNASANSRGSSSNSRKVARSDSVKGLRTSSPVKADPLRLPRPASAVSGSRASRPLSAGAGAQACRPASAGVGAQAGRLPSAGPGAKVCRPASAGAGSRAKPRRC